MFKKNKENMHCLVSTLRRRAERDYGRVICLRRIKNSPAERGCCFPHAFLQALGEADYLRLFELFFAFFFFAIVKVFIF